ncbi:MAG: hypothetical protein F6K58_31565 [Symploca sp. SIO2E9]|nr:hypothetical protein [Symploca sp. SIO2E9]
MESLPKVSSSEPNREYKYKVILGFIVFLTTAVSILPGAEIEIKLKLESRPIPDLLMEWIK